MSALSYLCGASGVPLLFKTVGDVRGGIQLRDPQLCTEEKIRAFCRGQIAHQKVPRYVRFVEEFLMTVTGKIHKFAMRDHVIQELNLQTEKTA